MYIHDLGCTWMNHPFFKNRFKIEDRATLDKINAAGLDIVAIDTALGLDVEEASACAEEEPADLEDHSAASTNLSGVILGRASAEEFEHAKAVLSDASKMMHDMMRDVRLGKQVNLEQCEPMVDKIVETMFNCPSSVLPLAQIKSIDEYTFQHSVAVAALSVAFGRVLELPRLEIKQLALGGMLHDLGKARVPLRLLNKPGKLTDEEYALMKTHVVASAELLQGIAAISEVSRNAAAQHHERYDGSGYPNRLKGDEISLHGQMLAIVDVYDAITSLRVYHKPMPPTEALRRLYEWSGSQFNPRLVQAFIKGIGIYPAGSLVRLESDRLSIVRHITPDNLLQPVVEVMFDCARSCHLPPEIVDLATSGDKIKSHESYEKWGIDPAQWAVAGS